jgi:hypothetical protein
LRSLSGLDEMAFESVLPSSRVKIHSLKEMTRKSIGFKGGGDPSLDGASKKLMLAFREAEKRDRTLVVAAWDRDHGIDAALRVTRRDLMIEHMQRHRRQGQVPVLCIQEGEAWLLADANAARACGAEIRPKAWPTRPEEVKNPKEYLERILKDGGLELKAWLYTEIAESVDLAVLKNGCPNGYGKFVEHASELLVPVLRRA